MTKFLWMLAFCFLGIFPISRAFTRQHPTQEKPVYPQQQGRINPIKQRPQPKNVTFPSSPPENGIYPMIELCPDEAGLFSKLMRILEWIYCVQEDKRFGLYINMKGSYKNPDNLFTTLFNAFEDPQISLEPRGEKLVEMWHYPTHSRVPFVKNVWDGVNELHYWNDQSLITHPDSKLHVLRERLHPIVLKYFQPIPELQKKIDFFQEQMQVCTKIGIHVRCIRHYLKCKKTPEEFLDDVESDIDQWMQAKDPHTTKIFLATQLQPLVDRLSAKYHLVLADIPRTRDLFADWEEILREDSLDDAKDALIDTWCLSQCDEVWCGASNMIMFAGCINPHLKIRLLPSLNYVGS